MAADPVQKQISREVKRALSDAGVSARAAAVRLGKKDGKTVYRWINGDNYPSWDELEAFAEEIGPIRLDIGGQQKETPAEAGADEIVNLWLERWHDAPEPHWAQRLTEQIISTIETDREAAILSLARELGGSTYEQLREHLRRLRAESSQEATDQ